MTKLVKQAEGATDIDKQSSGNDGSSVVRTDIDDHSNRLDPYEIQLQTYVAVKKELTKKHKKSYFYGVVVTVDDVTFAECQAETSPGFMVRLARKREANSANIAIKKVRVYIPELQGFLPMLNKHDVTEFGKLRAKEISTTEFDFKPGEKDKYAYYERTLSRITPFYTAAHEPALLSDCKVEFSDENNMFFGTYLEKAGGN